MDMDLATNFNKCKKREMREQLQQKSVKSIILGIKVLDSWIYSLSCMCSYVVTLFYEAARVCWGFIDVCMGREWWVEEVSSILND